MGSLAEGSSMRCARSRFVERVGTRAVPTPLCANFRGLSSRNRSTMSLDTGVFPIPCWTLPLTTAPSGSVAPDLGSAISARVYQPGKP
jgi:hypothetical protein